MQKMPPMQKVYEAWSALADGRVRLADKAGDAPADINAEVVGTVVAAGKAEVISSNEEKTYLVQWRDGMIASTDNATYWQGYPGYPVIAVLMLLGLVPYEKPVSSQFAGIDWNTLNKRHKRDYDAALAEALDEKGLSAEARDGTSAAAQRVYDALLDLDFIIKRKLPKQ